MGWVKISKNWSTDAGSDGTHKQTVTKMLSTTSPYPLVRWLSCDTNKFSLSHGWRQCHSCGAEKGTLGCHIFPKRSFTMVKKGGSKLVHQKSHKLVPFVFKTYATQPRRCNYPSVLYGVLSPSFPVVNLKIFLPINVRNKFQKKANVKPAHQAKEKGWMDAV